MKRISSLLFIVFILLVFFVCPPVYSEPLSIVTINSTDQDSNIISGAEFRIIDSNNKNVTAWRSTEKSHIIENLPYGEYTIIEEVAPSGYKIDKKEIKFNITKNNNKITISVINTKIKNRVSIIYKNKNKIISGETIILVDKNNKEIKRFKSTKKEYIIDDLKDGTYRLYAKHNPKDSVRFTIDKDHQIQKIVLKKNNNTDSKIFVIVGFLLVLLSIGVLLKYEK